jgi:nitrate/nitrite transport system ATP-binding protein
LDEPLSALDALTRGSLQEEIARIWEETKKTVVLITNDVDEAIFLADRIIPLTPGPNATLGREIAVDLPRPRDRKALNHDRRFKELRAEVTDFLLSSASRNKTVLAKKLRLPDIEPEDLSIPRNIFSPRREPIRRREIKNEAVEVGRE